MKDTIANVLTTSKQFIIKKSPEILTGLGVAGMITGTVFGIAKTPKALKLIDAKKKELEKDKLSTKEVISAAWKCYIPTVAITIASSACIIGASTVHSKRNAALAAAYSLADTTLREYKDKVKETIGKDSEKKIIDALAKDKVAENDAKKDENTDKTSYKIIDTVDNSKHMYMDSLTCRTFPSDKGTIEAALNKLNETILKYDYASVNDFYELLDPGSQRPLLGDIFGWNSDRPLVEISYTPVINDKHEVTVVINFDIPPRKDFDKLG